jgi:hypothetical protein
MLLAVVVAQHIACTSEGARDSNIHFVVSCAAGAVTSCVHGIFEFVLRVHQRTVETITRRPELPTAEINVLQLGM